MNKKRARLSLVAYDSSPEKRSSPDSDIQMIDQSFFFSQTSSSVDLTASQSDDTLPLSMESENDGSSITTGLAEEINSSDDEIVALKTMPGPLNRKGFTVEISDGDEEEQPARGQRKWVIQESSRRLAEEINGDEEQRPPRAQWKRAIQAGPSTLGIPASRPSVAGPSAIRNTRKYRSSLLYCILTTATKIPPTFVGLPRFGN